MADDSVANVFGVLGPLADAEFGAVGRVVGQGEGADEDGVGVGWADTIIAWEVDAVVYPGKQAVLEAERLAVEVELPLYNYEWNLGNLYRVEIWRAKDQRWGARRRGRSAAVGAAGEAVPATDRRA
ncbi:MAG: hypothetical protein QOI01_3593 [Mycobacterium sp.]|nr:hypothetical protein [Mycobacterium sp.]